MNANQSRAYPESPGCSPVTCSLYGACPLEDGGACLRVDRDEADVELNDRMREEEE
jgi:hypothetical protein